MCPPPQRGSVSAAVSSRSDRIRGRMRVRTASRVFGAAVILTAELVATNARDGVSGIGEMLSLSARRRTALLRVSEPHRQQALQARCETALHRGPPCRNVARL